MTRPILYASQIAEHDALTAALLIRARRTARRAPRVYVAGPYTHPDPEMVALNIGVATELGVAVRRLGLVPLVPHIAIPGDGVGWKAAMLECLSHLQTCDFTLLAPGWEGSRGARVEAWLARRRATFPGLVTLEVLAEAQDLLARSRPPKTP